LIWEGRIVKGLERYGLVSVTVIGAIVLFASGLNDRNDAAGGGEAPGLIVRSEIEAIYAPRALIEFARAHPRVETNDQLVRLIHEAKVDAWFGVVFRTYLANGQVMNLAQTIRPGQRTELFESTRGALTLLAGHPIETAALDRSHVKIEEIEGPVVYMDPVKGLKQLLSREPDAPPRIGPSAGQSDLTGR
jgi:hypothetical protein